MFPEGEKHREKLHFNTANYCIGQKTGIGLCKYLQRGHKHGEKLHFNTASYYIGKTISIVLCKYLQKRKNTEKNFILTLQIIALVALEKQ